MKNETQVKGKQQANKKLYSKGLITIGVEESVWGKEIFENFRISNRESNSRE